MAETRARVEAEIRDELAPSPFKPAKLEALDGGTANFIFRAILENPLPDGTSAVIVKHGEAFVASMPDFALTTSRCHIEEECLRHLSKLPQFIAPGYAIGTPKVLNFNRSTNTQVQECLTNAINLKEYALKHLKSSSPESAKHWCLQLGQSLGQWLQSFHSWSKTQGELRQVLRGNKELQSLKHYINYRQLGQIAEQQPALLGDANDVFQAVADSTAAELQDEDKLDIIHGDFWTGNVLLPNQPFGDIDETPIWVIDWEMAQIATRPLDLGQMIAELWQLKLFKDIDAGTWIIEGFVAGYGKVDDEFAFRTILHVGAHLICFGSRTPGWGSLEQSEEIIKIGKDIIIKAWGKDRQAFRDHVLECLFTQN